MGKSPSPPQKTILYASKTKHESDFVKAAQDKMADEARTLRHYSPENAVANSSGFELLQSLRELRERQEALEVSHKKIRAELDEIREIHKGLRDNIGELERRQHNAQQWIISTFVRETRLPPRGLARRA